MLVGQHAARIGRLQHYLQKRVSDVALEQPVAILGKHRRHPHRSIRIQPHKPAKEQIVIELLHQLTLAPLRGKLAEYGNPDKAQMMFGFSAAPAARGVYKPRRPQASPLFRLVSDHLHRLQTVYDERFDAGPARDTRWPCRRG